MTDLRAVIVLMLATVLPACASSNPCPDGTVRSVREDRCIETTSKGPPDAGERLDTGPAAIDAGSSDAGTDAAASEPGLDATGPTPSRDATTDRSDDAASPPDADAVTDANADADMDASNAQTCGDSDLETWRNFHFAAGLVNAIATCTADASCTAQMCALDRCLMQTAGATGCAPCITDEVSCVANHCSAQCNSGSEDATCRACLCANDCSTAFDRCSQHAVLEVCADCDGTTCTNQSLAPELIMVVIDPLLGQMPSM